MSLRSKALALVEVLLRVPPLFVVDEFLKISLGLPVSSGEESVLGNITVDGIAVDLTDPDVNYYDANFYNAFFFTIVKFLVCCLGKGLGKHENGISEALKPKLKRSVAGVGHDGAAEFNDHWWTTLYDKAAANVEVTEKNGKTKKIKTKDDKEFVISTSTWKMNRKPKDGEEEEQYADYFVRTAVLTNGASNVERLREEESDDEGEKKDVFKMTDEELFKTCEGRTAHKGARHGLKATGKLARIAQQEALLLSQSRFSGYSHAKKLKEQVEDINLNSDSDSTERKKKKKKRKRCNSNEKSENNKVECVLAETEIPLTNESKVTDDDSVANVIKEVKVSRKSKKSKKKDFRDIESIPEEDEDVSEPKKKKKKKINDDTPVVMETENIMSIEKETNKLSKKKKKISVES